MARHPPAQRCEGITYTAAEVVFDRLQLCLHHHHHHQQQSAEEMADGGGSSRCGGDGEDGRRSTWRCE